MMSFVCQATAVKQGRDPQSCGTLTNQRALVKILHASSKRFFIQPR